MKKRSVMRVCVCLGFLIVAGSSHGQNVNTLLRWDPVTTLEDGSPLPANTPISYIVYAGDTEETMVEKERTEKVEIPLSSLNLKKEEVWLGVSATGPNHLQSVMATLKTVRVSSVLKLHLLHEITQ